MKKLLMIALAFSAAPAMAQDAAAASAATAPSPERLAAARATVDHIWPLGTYERMMRGSMEQMTDSMMASLLDVDVGTLAPAGSVEAEKGGQTLREAMAKADPNFQERMRIMNRVMMQEMVPLIARFEPQIREGLARSYARKFTAEQLADMNRFFATPSGAAYAHEAVAIMGEPEMMKAMAGVAPEIAREMPRIMAKVQAATAHLPAPKSSAD